MRRTSRLAGGAVIVLASLTAVAPAASAKPKAKPTPQATIKSLRAEVAKLKKQVTDDEGKLKSQSTEITGLEAKLKIAQAPPTTVAPTTTTVPAVIFQQSGSGIASTEAFHVPASWQLHWTYDCSSTGNSGNFMVDIDAPGDTDDSSPLVQDEGVNELGAGGSGVEHYYVGNADAILKIIAGCPWTVEVTP